MNEIAENSPFVGLRPFESHEGLLFFGRQQQTMELLQRLHKFHFVGIVGSSGCGKSSLIRAGLVPRLKAGYLVNERDNWVIAIFKPGETPVYNMAFVLLQELGFECSVESVRLLIKKIEEEGVDAIISLLRTALDNRTNVFVLVDQFEELFRFSMNANDSVKKDQAIDFVNILLALTRHGELPIYLVFTMRSDFIGECSQFFDLPEALNQSQYLVPRLTREQLKNVIEGPVMLFDAKVNPALLSRLLNDVQTVNDELPLLQHVLMRTWDYQMATSKKRELALEQYMQVGGIEKALSIHADEALTSMNEKEKNVARLMFQALTTTDAGGRKIRRPEHFIELVKLTGSSDEIVHKVIKHFNAEKRSFLVLSETADVYNPLIDISHESLIRQWDTLNTWVTAENESTKIYLRLSEAAALNKEGKKDLIGGTELQVALNWRDTNNPNEAWAARYNNSFKETIEFLEKSKTQFEIERKEKEIQQKKRLMRARIFAGVIFVLLLIATISSIYIYTLKDKASEALNKFQNGEAAKVTEKIQDIITRADSIKTQYPIEYTGMLIEADSIIDQDIYRDNDNLQTWSDSLDVLMVKAVINIDKQHLNGWQIAEYKTFLNKAKSILYEDRSRKNDFLKSVKLLIDSLIKENQ